MQLTPQVQLNPPGSVALYKVRVLWFDPNGQVVPDAIAVVHGNRLAAEQPTLTISTNPIPGEWGAVACYERGGVTEHIAYGRFVVSQ